jgi:hypothetical protein
MLWFSGEINYKDIIKEKIITHSRFHKITNNYKKNLKVTII